MSPPSKDSGSAPRPYRSERRAAGAAQTREAILAAAASLFAEHGYAATSLDQVASSAGVAVPTIYASVGGKSQIVAALSKQIVEAPLNLWADRSAGNQREVHNDDGDGRATVARVVRGIRTVFESGSTVVAVVMEAGRSNPDLREHAESLQRRYREQLTQFATWLDGQGHLRGDLTAADAYDLLHYYLVLQSWQTLIDIGWSWERAESWLTDHVTTELLGSQEAAKGTVAGGRDGDSLP